MTFDLQMFATTWKFDSGVGFADNNKTIRIKSGNGVGYVAKDVGSQTWTDVRNGADSTGASITDGLDIDAATATANLQIMVNPSTDAIYGLSMSGVTTKGVGTNVTAVDVLELTGKYDYAEGIVRSDGTTMEEANSGLNVNDGLDVAEVTLKHDLRFGGDNMLIDVDANTVTKIDLDGYNADLKLTSADDDLIINGIEGNNGIAREISFGKANKVKFTSEDNAFQGGTEVVVTTGKYTAQLNQGTNLQGVYVEGQGEGKLNFINEDRTGVLNFGEKSDSVYVENKGGAADLDVSFDQIDYAELKMTGGNVDITGMRGEQTVLINGTKNSASVNISSDNLDKGKTISENNQVSIVAADNGLSFDTNGNLVTPATLSVDLSGVGIETVDIGTHGGYVVATDWVEDKNVVSIGNHAVLAIEGDLDNEDLGQHIGTHLQGSGDSDKTGESGNPSILQFDSDSGKIKVNAQGNTYTAQLVGNKALTGSTSDNFGSADIIVGDMLNLGDVTDKKVVFLNTGIDTDPKDAWDDTYSYSANMTSVISSSAGGTKVIGDFENAIYFYGNGDLDSLFGGDSYGNGTTDTLASVGGKKAWMGTSDYSGKTVVELVHNGAQTYNFGFVDEFYSVDGSKNTVIANKASSGTETDETADVLALMNGAAYRELKASEHQLANLTIGADSENNFTFQSITEGQHKINYTYNLGKTNSTALVDTSLQGSKSGFDYDDDISFYLGFDNGTVLTFDSKDSKKKLNYDGGAVLMGISSIDGSKAGADNILNGETNHAEFIIGSETGATTLSGGFANGYVDTAADTLVGGNAADTFWVGANMGDDVVTNVGEGDTIVFLGSKLADATFAHDMLVHGDASNYTVAFEDGSTVKFSTATGTKMSDISSLTCKFDDATYSWNGTEWTKA